MAKYTILKNGLFRRSNRETPFGGELVLEQWLKSTAVKLGIPYDDACCANETVFPVGLDAAGNLQSFNADTQVWTDLNVASNVDPAITALGVDDTDGYALTKSLSIITGGADATGVELPAAAVGLEFTVVNLTANTKKVYATTGDAIDDKTATTGFIVLQPEEVVTFRAYTTALWQSDNEADGVYGTVYVDTIAENTATVGVTVDSVLLKDGGVSNVAVTMIASFYPQAIQDDIAAGTGGSIVVTNYLTTINTDAGGDAFTLADGTQIGQMKKILLVVDGGGDAVVTPATPFQGGNTATFDTAGEYVILQWSGAEWVVLENSGVVIA